MSFRDLTTLAFLCIGGSLAAETLTVTVLNESGEKVDTPSAFLLVETTIQAAVWPQKPFKISTGAVEFQVPEDLPKTKYQLYAVAKGYAYSHQTLELGTSETEIVLKPGKDIVLEFLPPEGKTLPENIKFFGHNAEAARHVWLYNMKPDRLGEYPFTLTTIKEHTENRFTTTIPETGDPMYFAASVPGINRAFLLGPYDPDELKSGQILPVNVPQGGGLSATFHVPSELQPKVTSGKIHLEAATTISISDGESDPLDMMIAVMEDEGTPEETLHLEADDLPLGRLYLSAGTGEEMIRWDRDRADYFLERIGVTIDPGKTIKKEFVFKTIDVEQLLKGNHHADITIKTLSGTPAANSPWKLHYSTRYGANLTILEGSTNTEGFVTLRNLDATKQDGGFSLFVGEKERFTLEFTPEPQTLTTTFTLSPQPGDRAPEIQGMELATGKTVRLSDHLGKVVLVDFWATWCGPCQPGMQHNAEMALKNTEWKDKVVILPVSCDDSKETLAKHVEKKGWGHLPNVWLDGENVGWEHPAMGAYGVRGIPTVVLVDQSGKIAWKGHPGSVNLEEKINELLEKGG